MNTARRGFVRLLILVPCLGIGGCIYEDPLAPGTTEPVDARLLGDWRCVSATTKDEGILGISKTAEGRYRAQFVAPEPEEDPAVFVADAVRFEEKILVNAQEILDGKPGKWTLVRYALATPNALSLEVAEDRPFREAKNRDERTRILRQELARSGFFQPFQTCTRVKP